MRATIPNPDGKLLPGMYLNVSVDSGPARSLVTIPAAAVAFNPYGSLVYVLHDENATSTSSSSNSSRRASLAAIRSVS